MTGADAIAPSDHPDRIASNEPDTEHDTLKYHLLGPSLTKAGLDAVDQKKVRPLTATFHRGTILRNGAGIGDYLQCLQRLKVFQQ